MRNERALQFRRGSQLAAQRATDAQALTMPILYDDWAPFVAYGGEGEPKIVHRPDGLYRIRQPHTSQAGWEPERTPNLWYRIDPHHAGTMEDPIPAAKGMEYFAGKYYVEDGALYICIRDSVNPMDYFPSQLVGSYFKIVE